MASALPEAAGQMLRGVPGLPPVLQTLHLLGVAALMGSVVMLALRVLNLAARRQNMQEMAQRLWPWFWGALVVMIASGLPFFVARPQRYLTNPVFEIKFIALAVALGSTLALWYRLRLPGPRNAARAHLGAAAFAQPDTVTPTLTLRVLSAVALLSWWLTALAGRWIAYADYLFWPG